MWLRTQAVVSALGFGLLATSAASAGDWPQWRGPDGTGVSDESGWVSEGREESLWTMNVGLGYSSFVVADGRVITVGFSEEDQQDTLHCLNATTGDPIWTHSYAAQKWDKYHGGGTLSTPTIDGDRIYHLDREGRFTCLQFADGEVVWEKNLKNEFDIDYPEWMFAASPVAIGDVVYVNVGRTLALNKNTGDVIWKTIKTGDAYSTPFPMEFSGKPHLVVFNSDGLFIFDRGNGEMVASHPWETQYDINAATPIVIGNRIFISSGQNRGCAMLELTGDGLEIVWENKSMSNKMSGCVLWDGHLYGFDEAILKCIDLDGNEQWRQRGLGMGALMLADGRLIAMSGKGELIVADASPGGYAEQSKTRVLEGGVYWTMPVLADGLIYCRNSLGDIVCRDHRAPGN